MLEMWHHREKTGTDYDYYMKQYYWVFLYVLCVHTYGLFKGKQDGLALVQKVSGSVPHPLEAC